MKLSLTSNQKTFTGILIGFVLGTLVALLIIIKMFW